MSCKIVPSIINVTLEVYDSGGALFGTMPCQSVSASYSVSSVPEASVTVPSGVSVCDQLFSKIQSGQFMDNANRWWRADVYVDLQGEEKPGVPWPTNRVLLFSGYIDGISIQSSPGDTVFLLKLRHWLSDLDDTPVKWRPIGIGDSFGSIDNMPAFFVSNFIDQKVSSFLDLFIASNTNMFSPLIDVWSCVIRPIVLEEYWLSVEYSEFPLIIPKYLHAYQAAAKITGTCGGYPSAYAAPLALRIVGALNEDVLRAIGWPVVLEVVNAVRMADRANSSIWDTIYSLQNQFLYAISPRADSAIVFPLNPVLNGYHLEIQPDEVFGMRSNLQSAKSVLMAVTELSMLTLDTSMATITPLIPSTIFFHEGPSDIISYSAPRWLNNAFKWLSSMAAGPDVYMPNPLADPFSNIQAFVQWMHSLSAKLARASLTAMVKSMSELMIAEHNARSRTTQVTGRLRFDVAPGSTILVRPPKSVVMEADPNYDPSSFSFVGFVRNVSYSIANQGHGNTIATTSFDISHVRSEKQLAQPGMVMPIHPFYTANFYGAPFTEGPW